MKREIITTEDGSHSVYCVDTYETFHSKYGAIQESMHVFIRNGLNSILENNKAPSILEIGFGTGLNALLTLARMVEVEASCQYVGIDKFPISLEIARDLDYLPEFRAEFLQMHQSQSEIELMGRMQLKKVVADFRDQMPTVESGFDLVYFDAFSPTKQPELWTATVFQNIKNVCAPNAILVTYCSKGEVRRNMQAAGWAVTKLPGPKGKREMVKGFTIDD